MTKQDRGNLIVIIENTAFYIESEIRCETVTLVLNKYGATSIEKINLSDFEDAFSELYAIEADLR